MGAVVLKIVVGMMEANCYIFADEVTREAAIIDPGADNKKIKRELDENGLSAKCIVNTHGHADHIGANGNFELPIYIHTLDAGFLEEPSKNLSAQFGVKIVSSPANRLLEDGDKVRVGNLELEVIHTPGHTPGGICLKYNNMVFTGDTLFCEGVGRTDFPYGSEAELMRSIEERLMSLEDEIIIYPGHGPSSTVGAEKKYNPFLGE